MDKEDSEKKTAKESNDGEELTVKSLIVHAKGIEPLILGVFIIFIYWIMIAIGYFLSYKFGRL